MRLTAILTVNSLLLSPALLEADQLGALEECAAAVSNPTEWAKITLESSDIVFLGAAVSVEVPTLDDKSANDSPDVNSMDELLRRIQSGQPNPKKNEQILYVQLATFELLRSWSGPDSPVISTKSLIDPPGYGFRFEIGENYLVNGKKSAIGFYWIKTSCNLTLTEAMAREHIAALDELAH